MLKRLFPNLPWDDAGKMMMLPAILVLAVSLIALFAIQIGEALGLAYGKRVDDVAIQRSMEKAAYADVVKAERARVVDYCRLDLCLGHGVK